MGCGRESSPIESVNKKGCVCDVVRAILDIQNQAVRDDCASCTTNCFLEPLGGIVSPARSYADTRVFSLLNKDGTPFLANYSYTPEEEGQGQGQGRGCRDQDQNNDACASIYFRVEDIFNGCCATLRVLVPQDNDRNVVDLLNEEGTKFNFRAACDVTRWVASDSCITVDLDCFCAVQCVADVNLGICN